MIAPYRWFVVANVITFTFITLLQVAHRHFFILFLVLMHCGIFLLIATKKRLVAGDDSIKRFYNTVYLLLALYVPLLLYKLLSNWLPINYKESIMRIGTLCVTVVAVSGSVCNSFKLYRFLTTAKV